MAEHSITGQARAVQLQSQLPVTEPKGHAADGASATATQQAAQTKSMQSVKIKTSAIVVATRAVLNNLQIP